jgi:hypothetical protein
MSDSIALENQRAADRRTADALLAAQQSQAIEQAAREAATRADQATAANAATAARVLHDQQIAGERTLGAWMGGVVSSVNAKDVRAPVLGTGPPEFLAFVDKYQPKLIDARLLSVTIHDGSGEATAVWVARWRTAFGPAASRLMKATATVVLIGDTWHLREWQLIEGAP